MNPSILQQERDKALSRIAELEAEVKRLTAKLDAYEADEYNRQIDMQCGADE